MTRVHFYQINGSVWETASLTSRLIEKALHNKLDVLVLCANSDFATSYHSNLAKHCGATPIHLGPTDVHQAVTISWDTPELHVGLVINLTPNVPPWFSRFERMAEVVYAEETLIESKRENFRFYRDRGYPLHYHDLSRQQRNQPIA